MHPMIFAQLAYGLVSILTLAAFGLVFDLPGLVVLAGAIFGLTYCYHLIAAFDPDEKRASFILTVVHLLVAALTVIGYFYALYFGVYYVHQGT